MKKMLEKEIARYKASWQATEAMWCALMEAETDEVLATDFIGSAKLIDIKQLRREIKTKEERLWGALVALNELDSKVPETDALRKRMKDSAFKYWLLARRLEAKTA